MVQAGTVITSPSRSIVATVSVDSCGRLQYGLSRDGRTVLEDSPLGITVEGVDLGAAVVSIGASAPVEVEETYPWRGVKSVAVNHYNEVTLQIARAGASDAVLTMTWRVYDDGAAYRYGIPGSGTRTLNGEMSAWKLPAGTTVWTQLNTSNYEGEFTSLQAGAFGVVVTTPLTCKLPGTGGVADGYAAIMEGALSNYSGMTLEPVDGSRILRSKFVSDDAWPVPGGSSTPWRITVATATLNELVNSTLVANVNPPPAPVLANASWIRPGRVLWSWWVNGVTRYEDQVPYMNAAAELGFEYVLWDEHWDTWPAADLDFLLNWAKSRGVGGVVVEALDDAGDARPAGGLLRVDRRQEQGAGREDHCGGEDRLHGQREPSENGLV